MSQGPLSPNLTKKVQKEVSQMVNCNLPIGIQKKNRNKNSMVNNNMLASWKFDSYHLVPAVYPGFPPGGRQHTIFAKISQKLHENRKNLGAGGGRILPN